MRSWRRFPSRPAAATMAGRRKPPSDRDRRADRRLRCGARRWSGASRPAAPPVPECAPRGRPREPWAQGAQQGRNAHCAPIGQDHPRQSATDCGCLGAPEARRPSMARMTVLRLRPVRFAASFGVMVGMGGRSPWALRMGIMPTEGLISGHSGSPSRGSSISGRSLRRPARSAAP